MALVLVVPERCCEAFDSRHSTNSRLCFATDEKRYHAARDLFVEGVRWLLTRKPKHDALPHKQLSRLKRDVRMQFDDTYVDRR